MAESLLDAVGSETKPAEETPDRAAAIRFVLADRPRRVCAAPSIDAVVGVAEVVRAKLNVPGSAAVRVARSSHDRLGYLLAVAADAERAAQAAETGHDALVADLFEAGPAPRSTSCP